jgi:mannose-6-phosphate isomerase-like protein (cupin superfamily)
MDGFLTNIEEATLDNDNFRKVIFTAPHSQLVLMSLNPGEDIGMEIHADNDQFIRIETGKGRAILNGKESDISDDWAIVVPAGTEHNIINTGDTPMKLYTLYSPPEHPDGTIHQTKEEAMEEEE